ncbi:MAG: hypothetical protein U0166_07380 [Acidobacteriota bacterium]
MADLSGADVRAWKAVILARVGARDAGRRGARLEGLVDPALAGLDRDTLLARPILGRSAGAPPSRRAANAGDAPLLRASRPEASTWVRSRLSCFPLDAWGANCVSLPRSERYRDRPLVVTGPGAGT